MKLIACGRNHGYKYFPKLHNILLLNTAKRIKHLGNKCLIQLENVFLDCDLFLNEGNEYQNKNLIIKQFIRKGCGIEIGALHHPVKVRKGVQVKYVDRLSVAKLREQYPELSKMQLVEVDFIADGEILEPIESFTQDFVIANHFLEHCQNPILAIENMLRVLKRSGILFVSIPDKRYSFDVNRPITPYDHLVKDYEKGPEVSRRQHFEEWVRLVNNATDDIEVERQIRHLMEINYSIHFHVWTETEMIELFLKQKSIHDFEIELFFRSINEMIFVLRKGS
jgi:predicted SAM-dependent methyltransferase